MKKPSKNLIICYLYKCKWEIKKNIYFSLEQLLAMANITFYSASKRIVDVRTSECFHINTAHHGNNLACHRNGYSMSTDAETTISSKYDSLCLDR